MEPTCQLTTAATTTTYSTTAPNSNGFNWSISNPAAGTINPTTGVMTWAIGFSGSVNIQVTANGCNSPSIQVIRIVTLTPSAGIPTAITISAGTEPTCQLLNATTTTTYATSALNSLSFSWSISNPDAGIMNPATGEISWAKGFAGNVDIQVKAIGCSGSSVQVIRTVIVAPNVGTPTPITISVGTDPTCQLTNAITTTTYTTTAIGNSGFNWSISNPAAGNIIPSTGVMTWNNGFAGSVNILVSANGCSGTSSQVIRKVIITPIVGTPTAITISAGTEPTCQLTESTNITTYATTATDNTGLIWSISNPAAGTMNPTTGVMLWRYNFSGSIDIQVIANGCNGTSIQVLRTVIVTPSVAIPVFTMGESSERCPGAGTVIYAATAANSTGINYNLDANSLSAGNTINSATGEMAFTAGWIGVSTITVTATGCNGPLTATHNVTVNPLPIPIITGPASVCINSSGNVYTTEPEMINYIWSVSAGGTITAGGKTNSNTVTVKWNATGPQTVRVIYANAIRCNAASAALYPVIVNPLPIPIITGNNNLCIGSSGVVYTTEPGMTAYNWIISGGGLITAGGTLNDNTVTVTWNTEGAQNLSVNYTNISGCSITNPTVYNVAVYPLPTPAISGPSTACINSTGNVYTTEAGKTNYAWNVSAGGTITSGGMLTDHTVTVTWNTAGSKTVSVNYTNGNGCAATSAIVYPVTVKALAIASLNGANSLCVGTTGVVYTTESGMTQYHWIISTGGTKTSGGTLTDNTITVTWNTVGTQSVSVDYTPSGGCASIPTVLPVIVNPLPTPTITGTSSICVGTPSNVYTTQAGMSNYVWNISSGGSITAGGTATSNAVTVTWNTAGSQTVNVNYSNITGCQAMTTGKFDVTVNAMPEPAGSITGSAKVNVGAKGVAYSISLIPNATSYIWSIPAGATIASGDGTNSITLNYATNASAGNIVVNGNNTCGAGIVSPPFAVTINTFPEVPGNITGSSTICQGTIGITYTVPLINYATGYVWTIPSGTTITSGDNTNSITVNYGLNAVSGNVTVYGKNTNGNGSVSSPLVVTVNPLPATPVIRVDDASGIILTSNSTTGNQWYDMSGPITGATNQTYNAIHVGRHYVEVTGACKSAQSNAIIITRVSVNATDKQKIAVYPNPSNGGFWIEYKSSENEKLKMIQVLDLLGKPVYQLLQEKPTSDYKEWVNIKNHPIGVYILVLTTESRKISRRIVITR